MIYLDLKDDLSEKMVYDHPDCPVYTIHELLSHYPNYSAISHWHDDIEFLMIRSGQMQYNVNGKILTLEQGQGIFVNSGRCIMVFLKVTENVNFSVFSFTPCFCAHYLLMKKTSSFL